jgi:putative endonuclease
MAKGGWVYILTNKFRGVLYIGVTSDLSNRLNQHHVATDSFPARYKLIEKSNATWQDLLDPETSSG